MFISYNNDKPSYTQQAIKSIFNKKDMKYLFPAQLDGEVDSNVMDSFLKNKI